MSARCSSSVQVEWCTARTAEHRSHLSVFKCADPDYSHFDEETEEEWHELPWEFEVQEHINALAVPAHAPHFLILGYAAGRLAVVLQLLVQHFDRYCFVKVVAVANWARGNKLGRQALDLVPAVMAKYGMRSDFTVEAHIDRDNAPSQELFEEFGYTHVEMRSGYQVWARHWD